MRKLDWETHSAVSCTVAKIILRARRCQERYLIINMSSLGRVLFERFNLTFELVGDVFLRVWGQYAESEIDPIIAGVDIVLREMVFDIDCLNESLSLIYKHRCLVDGVEDNQHD